jgi:hypothetical protein
MVIEHTRAREKDYGSNTSGLCFVTCLDGGQRAFPA